MFTQTIIFLLIGIFFLVLIAINAFLIRNSYKVNKKIDRLLEGGKIKDFKDIFLAQRDRNDNLEGEIKEAFLKIKILENTCETTIQKISVVRFNPFNDMGGDQSFAIALLDNKDNGFIISSLFMSDGNRVYTKEIKQGKAERVLLKEEAEALEKAINSKQ